MDTQRAEFRRMWALLKSGDLDQLEEEAGRRSDFPEGVDGVGRRRWIINAIDSETPATVAWMLDKGVDLDFTDEEGSTPLLAAIWKKGKACPEILELLLAAGAPVNRKGISDYTPAHMAAVRNDVATLQTLIRYGADLSIRTNVDNYATPLEEARRSGEANRDAVRYLEQVMQDRME